jgi:hypothetical protein
VRGPLIAACICLLPGVATADPDARADRRADDAKTMQMHREGVRDIRDRGKRDDKKPAADKGTKERDALRRDDRGADQRR